MMINNLASFLLLILYNIYVRGVHSAGVPYNNHFTKLSTLNENNATTSLEYIKNFEYKFEALSQTINKIDSSLQNLQEKSHTWVIFKHHINSWNEGIRTLENKIDILKRTHEEQEHKLELVITNKNKINEHYELIFDDLKQFLLSERKTKTDISLKINNILKHIQLLSLCNNEKKSSKKANIVAPIEGSSMPRQCVYKNTSNEIEHHVNNLSYQMALQKDLKQLNSLEKRNSRILENMNQVLNDNLKKYELFTTRFQKSNECCYSLSRELSTFTESSDTLLKRIEKLVRNVSQKPDEIEVTNVDELTDDSERTSIESHETEIDESFSNDDLNKLGDHNELEEENFKSNIDLGKNVIEHFEYDDSHDVEFIRPSLSGCHELRDELTDVDDDSAYIDGIYKFSSPIINQDERDFNERYCVFPRFPNDTGSPWTLIQRRGPYKEQENFNRSWSEYRNGFGHLSRDFWFGNEFIHRLVYNDDYELRIELEDFDGIEMWAEYSTFRIESEKYNYNLLIGGQSGTIEDAMQYHNDNDFSTYDKRNDKTVDACCSCAVGYASGWWFDNCSEANLNGIYRDTPFGHNYIGIMWELWHGDYSLKTTRMMIRPRKIEIHSSLMDSHNSQSYTEDP